MGTVADSNFSINSLTEASSNYKRKAWVALFGVMVFVSIYVLFTSWLIFSSYRFISVAMAGGNDDFKAVLCAIPAVFLSLFMVKALFFLQRGGDAGYIELKAREEPELVNFIYQLADESGAPRPHKIYLSPMVNAAVFYDLTILNFLFPSKKNLLIGLGLVNVLNRSEFKAVLAHEFGHFSQRSMAIGRWVYISEQITAHIVGARGALDKLLHFISNIDLRVAWIGWAMSIIVWSIRSFLETVYRLVSRTHKALSREMEYQADLVSVSLTGSDALVHALHKLQAADEAWGLSLQFMEDEFKEKRSVENLFTVHNRTLNHLRRVLDDPEYGISPQIPQVNPEKFRVFKEELAQPPQMWLTHPVNSDREANAKRIYIPSEIDDNSAWDLFANPEKTKKKITKEMLKHIPDVENVPIEKTLEELDAYFGKRRYDRKYHGVYLGRDVTRHLDAAEKMTRPLEYDDLIQELDNLYPDELSEKMELLRNLHEEHGLLEAIKEKQMDASGGIINHRGRQLQRSELPDVLKKLDVEIKEMEGFINKHEDRCRSLHRHAAAYIGWEKFHVGSCRLLHYAEHSFANIADLAGVMGNTVAIVLADGRVTSKELEQVLLTGGRLHRAIRTIYQSKSSVIVSSGVAEEMKIESWAEHLEKFKLPSPTRDNINEWMQVIDGWIQVTLSDLGALRTAALNQLLKTEEEIREHLNNDNREAPSPQPTPKVPRKYDTLVSGKERKLQSKLGWWDSFHVADGPVSLTLRLIVACAIIGALVYFGSEI